MTAPDRCEESITPCGPCRMAESRSSSYLAGSEAGSGNVLLVAERIGRPTASVRTVAVNEASSRCGNFSRSWHGDSGRPSKWSRGRRPRSCEPWRA